MNGTAKYKQLMCVREREAYARFGARDSIITKTRHVKSESVEETQQNLIQLATNLSPVCISVSYPTCP